MTILEQAEELRQKAIALLVQERETINQKLNQLGYEGTEKGSRKKCGRCGQEGHSVRTCTASSPETTE